MDVELADGVKEEAVQTEVENNGNDIPRSTSKTSGYLLVDHEEELNQQMECLRKDVNEQIKQLRDEIEVTKETLCRLTLVVLPLIAGWVLLVLTKMIFSRPYDGYVMGINCGIIISVFLFDVFPLNDPLQQMFNRISRRYFPVITPNIRRSGSQNEESGSQTSVTDNVTMDKQIQTIGEQVSDTSEQTTQQP